MNKTIQTIGAIGFLAAVILFSAGMITWWGLLLTAVICIMYMKVEN